MIGILNPILTAGTGTPTTPPVTTISLPPRLIGIGNLLGSPLLTSALVRVGE